MLKHGPKSQVAVGDFVWGHHKFYRDDESANANGKKAGLETQVATRSSKPVLKSSVLDGEVADVANRVGHRPQREVVPEEEVSGFPHHFHPHVHFHIPHQSFVWLKSA